MITEDQIISDDFSWYFGEISREKTNEILIDQPIGTFLVRDSTTQFGYALAVKEANEVKRFLISYQQNAKKFKFGEFYYDSLEELIRYYTSSKSSICRRVQPALKASYVCLYNLQSQHEGDLTFNRGDLLNFIRQKGSWIFCKASNGRVGWVPLNYVTPFTPELAAILRGQSNQDDISYCQLINFIQLPATAKVLRSRNPSIFAVGHLNIQCDDQVQVRKIFSNGFCDVWRERDHIGGLVPINYLEIKCK